MRSLSLLITSLLLICTFNVYAADTVSAAGRVELLLRLDSIEVEKQTLKRQGKPLRELETAASQIRDSLAAMRAHIAPSEQQRSSEKNFSLPFSLPFSSAVSNSFSKIAFSPRNFFDWFIIVVGIVAVLSVFLLVIGVLHTARAKKRRAGAAAPKAKSKDKSKEKAVSKRMNLAPQENHTAAQLPEIPKMAPMPQPQTPPPSFGGYDFAGRVNLNGQSAEAQNKKEVSNSDDKVLALLKERILSASAPEQQTAAAPLFVTGEQAPPPKISPAFSAPPVGASAQELVMSASQEGLSAQEISKRHQISIDQVNLILRMAKK